MGRFLLLSLLFFALFFAECRSDELYSHLERYATAACGQLVQEIYSLVPAQSSCDASPCVPLWNASARRQGCTGSPNASAVLPLRFAYFEADHCPKAALHQFQALVPNVCIESPAGSIRANCHSSGGLFYELWLGDSCAGPANATAIFEPTCKSTGGMSFRGSCAGKQLEKTGMDEPNVGGLQLRSTDEIGKVALRIVALLESHHTQLH